MDASVLADVGRTTLALSFPDEVDELAAALARSSGDKGRRPSPPVGMGVELLPLADHLVAVLTFLFGAAASRVTERATDAVTDRTKAALANLLAHEGFAATPAAAALDADQEREVFDAVVNELDGVVSPEVAAALGKGVIGALRLRGGDDR